VAAVAAAALLFIDRAPRLEPSPSSAGEESAAAALTNAQRAWLRSSTPAARVSLESALAAYREASLAAVTARYGR
jgi:uncharacterized protein YecT (DUF1311 family)